MEHVVKIIAVKYVTHDVKRFTLEKPAGYHFESGQATEVSINKPGLENEKRPFTFTSLDEDPHLEFTIKIYRDHDGVTKKLGDLDKGDQLIVRDVWGAIEYRGPGYFIAGGAGITPFISIFRKLKKENKLAGNKLFFSNKTSLDIILEDEFTPMLGNNVIYTLTGEKHKGYDSRYIDESFLKKEIADVSKHFYVCGPPKMVEDVSSILLKMGASPEAVVFEK